MESERELKTITKLDENVHHMSILMSPEVCWIIPNMMFSQFDVMRVSQLSIGGVTGFLGSLKISPWEERRLKDTQNPKCEDRRFQNCLCLKTEDQVTKLTKPED